MCAGGADLSSTAPGWLLHMVYRRPPRLGTTLERREDGQDQAVIAIAWKAQQRLHHVWRQLDFKRGKRRTIVAVAVARELAGFCWAIITHNSEPLRPCPVPPASLPAGDPLTQTAPNPRSRENGT